MNRLNRRISNSSRTTKDERGRRRPLLTIDRFANRTAVLCLLLVGWSSVVGSQTATAEDVLVRWEFDRAGQMEGWQANSHLRASQVADGVLTTTVVNWDPILVHSALPEPIQATPTQIVAIRLHSPTTGVAELFWTGTTRGRYGGFAPEKRTPFELRPGWHTYRVRPFWQGEGKIVKLRLDLPGIRGGEDSEQTYQIDWIRIIDLGTSGPAVPAAWDFADGTQGWCVDGEGSVRAEEGRLVASLQPGARLIAPSVRVDAYRDVFVSFQMAVETVGDGPKDQAGGRIFWAAVKRNGLGQLDFPIRADGLPHVYNLPVSVQTEWRGQVIYLALEPVVGKSCRVRLDWVRCSPKPV
ncbi:MAG: hypothetical protein GXP27_08765, partial [Planctomycetes bacterium]|nr:hypothetical protein [Planctomycetota bacterium]